MTTTAEAVERVKAVSAWQIVRRRTVHSGLPGGSRKAVFMWEPEPGFPLFTTTIDAKRHLMVALDPQLANASDVHIARHYRAHQANTGHHKLARATQSTKESTNG